MRFIYVAFKYLKYSQARSSKAYFLNLLSESDWILEPVMLIINLNLWSCFSLVRKHIYKLCSRDGRDFTGLTTAQVCATVAMLVPQTSRSTLFFCLKNFAFVRIDLYGYWLCE